jgi:hypothetical protein
MRRLCQFIFCLAAALVAVPAPAQNGQSPPQLAPQFNFRKNSNPAINPPPPLPQSTPPVAFFRQLLLMPPLERYQALTNRSPAARALILAKVREYQALTPDERELRLRATELRWYLTPLLHTPPAGRAEQLARVPAELRGIVQSRLTHWDLLPPSLQQQFLASDKTLNYLAHAEPPNPMDANSQQQKITERFEQFFELKPAEKQRLLSTLSGAERAQMQKTLNTFAQLPLPQRARYITNYAKFAGMSLEERSEFLKNAESWSKMSPQERQTWRELVTRVPPAIMPPLPPPAPHRLPKTGMATN